MTAQVWGGVFEGATDKLMEAFGASLDVDARLAPMDALTNHAHLQMLLSTGVLQASQATPLLGALADVLAGLLGGTLSARGAFEDVHTWVEAELSAWVGAASENLRLARSRNDVVATDLRLWVRQSAVGLAQGLLEVQQSLLVKAELHAGTLVPGYTHLQRAQPVTVGHHLMAYVDMLERDVGRMAQAFVECNAACPLGAGSLATSTWPTQPSMSAELLGFAAPFGNSMDAVADRYFVLTMHHAVAVTMSHLSRLAEDLILWTTTEFGFATLPDAFSTGSSLMPQKKNPDVLELIRGRTAIVLGHLTGAFALLKGLPLTYNRDLQEDKACLFASVDILSAALQILAPFMAHLTVNAARCEGAASDDMLLATDVADTLVRQGQSFATAHHRTGEAVRQSLHSHQSLVAVAGLSLSAVQVLQQKTVSGGPGAVAVATALQAAQRRLAERRSEWHERQQKDRAPYDRVLQSAGRTLPPS